MRKSYKHVKRVFPKAIAELESESPTDGSEPVDPSYHRDNGHFRIDDGKLTWWPDSSDDFALEWSPKDGSWFFEGEVELATGREG